MFLSLLLRYDAVKSKMDLAQIEFKSFPRPYFTIGLISYAIGLSFTISMMYIFNSGQVR